MPHQFKLIRQQALPNYDGDFFEYKHPNGLVIYALINKDKDRAFDITVKTPVNDDTGVAHILEHCVLAGSKRYPVRDPFFSYLNASPNTFMNAYTMSDSTSYLASSQVVKDFDNLFGIYFDAVYYPLLRAETFWQEGHRIEYTPEEQAQYVGVVFNEMKAHQASSDVQGYLAIRQSLADKSSTYYYESGGMPEAITNLTWEGLRKFHHSYYHPANSAIAFYGDLDLSKYLELIETWLKDWQSTGDEITVNYQAITAPQQLDLITRKVQMPSAQTVQEAETILLGWRGEDIKTELDLLDWDLLEAYLMEDDTAPLKLALDQSGIGDSTWVYTGVEVNKQPFWYFGRAGAGKDQLPRLQELLIGTFLKLSQQEVSTQYREYLLRKISINKRKYKPAIDFASQIVGTWKYGYDPLFTLDIDKFLVILGERIMQPDFFAKSLQKLARAQFSQVYLEPIADLTQQYAHQLDQKLAKQLDSLDTLVIRNNQATLTEFMAQSEDISMLPNIAPTDIDTDLEIIPGNQETLSDNTDIYSHNLATNDLAHVNLLVTLPELTAEQVAYLPLYTSLLSRCGVEALTKSQFIELQKQELAQRIHAAAGVDQHYQTRDTQITITISGTSLNTDAVKLVKMIKQLTVSPNFDLESINLAIAEAYQQAEQEALHSGHSLAATAAMRGKSLFGYWSDLLIGTEQLATLKDLYNLVQQNQTAQILSQLQHLTQLINSSSTFSWSVTSDKLPSLLKQPIWSITETKPETKKSLGDDQLPQLKREAWLSGSDVNYVTATFAAPRYFTKAGAVAQVLRQVARSGFLHNQVRERGGAYGGGLMYSNSLESFTFFSYRDPNDVKTLDIFQDCIDWLLQGEYESDALNNAICLVIGQLDAPSSPAAKGLTQTKRMKLGITDTMRKQVRLDLINTQEKDLIKLAKNFLANQTSIVVIVGSKKLNELSGFNIMQLMQHTR